MDQKTAGDRQNLKKQRIKMYFLAAAKEIIIKEGVENVSVRKVADIAGYSYATIYNYFQDLNAMLWDTRSIMINDLVEMIKNKMQQSPGDTNDIKRLFRIYIEYYLQSPNVFKFFYLNHLNRPDREVEEAEPDYSSMWEETFKGFVLDGTLNEKDIEAVTKTLIYAVHGMLTIYYSNNGDLTEENIYKDLDKMIDYLLAGKGARG